ncbi:MAG: N-acetyltransferase [Selenomonadaceae bacterium]|nr:N-acetyltransferase [Selenomonadaceae bacterium]
MGLTKINLRDLLETTPMEKIESMLSDFSCPLNKDVESFLRTKAIIFAQQQLASTYLVFSSFREKMVLVGYFALTQKYIHVDLRKSGGISSKLRHRLNKFATYIPEIKKHQIIAPLIGQLGKNYANHYDELVSGRELLKLACDTVAEAQRILGGKVVYLECEDVPSLKKFYSENGFFEFGKRCLDVDEKDTIYGHYLVQFLKYL